MSGKVPFNPFKGPDEFHGKNPKDMTLDELRMYMHIKRLNIRLDLERFEQSINYTQFFVNIIKQSGLLELAEGWLSGKSASKPKTDQKQEKST